MGEQSLPPNQNGIRKGTEEAGQPSNENESNENEINTEGESCRNIYFDSLSKYF